MEFWIPYGTTEVPVRIPDDNFYKVLEPPKPAASNDPTTLLSRALDDPLGGLALSELAKPGGRAGIVVDPLVPPSFVEAAIEALRTRLGKLNVSDVTVFLRKRTSNCAQPSLVQETLLDPSQGPFTEIGKTSSGTPVQVRKEFLDCTVKVSLGLVSPHFATGFTGGPDAVLPGVSSAETIARNRSLLLRGGPSGIDDSWGPVFSDALEACKLGGPLYTISVVPDGWGGVQGVYSGEVEAAFKEAVARFTEIHCPKIDRKPDIVVLSAGGILGMDLYHSVRILSNAWNTVRREGTLILAAECSKGIGDQSFLDFSRRFEDRKALTAELRHHFTLGAHVALFLKEALERNRVQLVSVLPDHYARMFSLKTSKTATGAIQSSLRAEGKDAKVLVLTKADLTQPVVQPTQASPR